MMECFQVILLFILLVPVPTASPIFIALYLIAVFLAVSPCGSCIGWCAILFLATSPSSPFISSTSPHLPINPEYPLTSPNEERKWLNWNAGRIWDPTLAGYAHFIDLPDNSTITIAIDAPPSEIAPLGEERGLLRKAWNLGVRSLAAAMDRMTSRSPTASLNFSSTPSEPNTSAPDTPSLDDVPMEMPPQYIDFRWLGLGAVLDFGLKRSEAGMAWELEEYRRSSPSRRTALPPTPPVPPIDTKGSWIGRMPLLGSW